MTGRTRRPNVIFVMTDDQGYGDLSCTGNPWLATPHIDAFSRQCTRLEDFHVSPLCTPTRGAIMSGRNPMRNGAWATTWGRSLLGPDEVTLAELFEAGGYRTGMFGKWHLGDNYPYRPQDRGFQHVVAHKGGGVGQTPDFWGNSYFDDTYFHNGRPVHHDGYCTDVWFDAAMDFIRDAQDQPFFCYLCTNAPHGPYRVAEAYAEPYRNHPDIPHPNFYGMIANIDENFGRLVALLDERDLAEDTILIFTTDNGSSGGWDAAAGRGYNAGMRGQKGSYYDGGHRVPFFFRWPAGGTPADREVRQLVTHMDLMPTFANLCGLDRPTDRPLDGLSVAPLLTGGDVDLPDRAIFVQYRQSTLPPEQWSNAVMTRRWRLLGGERLYDIQADPGQQVDVAGEHPEVVARLRGAHEQWWAEVAPGLDTYHPISLGSEHENPTRLDAFDLMGDVAWSQQHVRQALKACGRWRVKVERPGRYRITLRRWPAEAAAAIDALPPDGQGVAISVDRARVTIGDSDQTRSVAAGEETATFDLTLPAGEDDLQAVFAGADGEQAAYYAYVERTG